MLSDHARWEGCGSMRAGDGAREIPGDPGGGSARETKVAGARACSVVL